jgi:proline iminopeptidase
LLPNEKSSEAFAKDELAWNLARLEAKYFRSGIHPDNLLLNRVHRLRDIPAFAVHGRYDIVCPVKSLEDLRRAWPELDCEIVPDAGHSSHEPGITRELVAATNRIAATGSPIRSERK